VITQDRRQRQRNQRSLARQRHAAEQHSGNRLRESAEVIIGLANRAADLVLAASYC